MALTRTEDKTDKTIARLLMQNPIGLTIGDITAEAKCTPQAARKSLARIGAEKDASGMLYVLRDDDEPVQAEPAPEPQAVQAEPEQATVQYKNNDIVMILWSDADAHPDQKEMIGTVRMIELAYVRSQAPGTPEFVVLTKGNNGKVFAWRPQQVRLATKSEIEAAGDLAPVFDHSAEHVLEKASTTLPAPPAEVTLTTPLTGLQQRILTLLAQHRGLTAQRIAEDLHADPESVHDALHDLSHLVASRPLMLPEIKVWEVVA